jgi:hypothetical protein
MKNKNSKIGITAFLIIIVATINMPAFLKYSLLFVATISFIITITQLYYNFNPKQVNFKDKK